jgi:hypothetical protein
VRLLLAFILALVLSGVFKNESEDDDEGERGV